MERSPFGIRNEYPHSPWDTNRADRKFYVASSTANEEHVCIYIHTYVYPACKAWHGMDSKNNTIGKKKRNLRIIGIATSAMNTKVDFIGTKIDTGCFTILSNILG